MAGLWTKEIKLRCSWHFCGTLAVALLSIFPMMLPVKQVQAQTLAMSRQEVSAFERDMRQIKDEQELTRRLRGFYRALKDKDAKIAAIGMVAGPYGSVVPKSIQAELLEPFMSDANATVQACAIEKLGYIRMARGVDTRRQAKKLAARLVGEPELRAAILGALGQMRYSEYAAKAQMYLTDTDATVRAAAAFALALISAPKDTYAGEIAALLKDTDRNVRQRAMDGLYHLNAQRAVPQIETMLHDPDEYIRIDATYLLVYAKSQTSVSAITKLLDDPSESVRHNARIALSELAASIEQGPKIKREAK